MDAAKLAILDQLEFLKLRESYLEEVLDPLADRTPEDVADPARHTLRLMRNPDYFYFTCKQLLGVELYPFQCVLLKELWTRKFPMLIGSRGMGKSFILGLYAVLRALLVQGSKVVITGSGFRQAKTVFNYAVKHWYDSPALRELCSENSRSGPTFGADRWVLRLGESTITALPVGDGTKIRGERANVIIADEFASIPKDIFETVIAGFGVVNLNPVAQSKERARLRVRRRLGMITKEQEDAARNAGLGNQTIISGTAYYQFNHFADYWKRWKGIIESRGDGKRLAALFEDGEVPADLDWRDFSIIRVPVYLLPDGFMDEKAVAKSKGTVHSGTFQNEFGAVFSADSKGFYPRTMLETCVTRNPVTPKIPGAEPVQFRPLTRGNPARTYIMGVDPAAENDNFAIVILEIHEQHRRIVHCWTTTKARHRSRERRGLVEDKDYYAYCARKIRELMKAFPCEVIAMDAQGGGDRILEALHDSDKLKPGEQPLWRVTPDHPLSDGKERDEDAMAGLHMVELVQFAQAQWVSDANHGMKKDFEDLVLLFPMQDTVMQFEADTEDLARGRKISSYEDCEDDGYDGLSACVDEINTLIDELTTIVHTQTPGTMRDHWDTPEVKTEGSKKGRLRKDRYSALLMANSAARRLHRQLKLPEQEAYGGFASSIFVGKKDAGGEMYAFAPDWFAKQVEGDYSGYGWVAEEPVY